MQRKEVANSVALTLFAAEAAIDNALSATSELGALLPRARQDARLSAVIGQDVFDNLLEASIALTEARRAAVALHGGLAAVSERYRLPVVGVGGYDKTNPPPNPPPPGGGGVTARAAAREAV